MFCLPPIKNEGIEFIYRIKSNFGTNLRRITLCRRLEGSKIFRLYHFLFKFELSKVLNVMEPTD